MSLCHAQRASYFINFIFCLLEGKSNQGPIRLSWKLMFNIHSVWMIQTQTSWMQFQLWFALQNVHIDDGHDFLMILSSMQLYYRQYKTLMYILSSVLVLTVFIKVSQKTVAQKLVEKRTILNRFPIKTIFKILKTLSFGQILFPIFKVTTS